MPTSCLRCARWGTCICCGTSCCFWHQHSPAAKIADHERAAEAGHDGKKTNSSASTGMLNTQRLKDTGLFRVSLALWSWHHPPCASDSRGARALPATRESCRPSVPARRSALCVLVAYDTACAVAVSATVRLASSSAAASRPAPPARRHWLGARRLRWARILHNDGAPVPARWCETSRHTPGSSAARSCHAAAPWLLPRDTAPRSAWLADNSALAPRWLLPTASCPLSPSPSPQPDSALCCSTRFAPI